ncbi:hypothetical protein [Paraburkholderia sp. GAS32]|uniref:hypothetical protein n=1 Tax=Paraburkholderia sp. GAS32 TaxID=3035129 RepID=UPI003D20A418
MSSKTRFKFTIGKGRIQGEYEKEEDEKDEKWSALTKVSIAFGGLLLIAGIYGAFSHNFGPFNRLLDAETTTVQAVGEEHHQLKMDEKHDKHD